MNPLILLCVVLCSGLSNAHYMKNDGDVGSSVNNNVGANNVGAGVIDNEIIIHNQSSNSTYICDCIIPDNYLVYGGGIIFISFMALFMGCYSIYYSNSSFQRFIRTNSLLNN